MYSRRRRIGGDRRFRMVALVVRDGERDRPAGCGLHIEPDQGSRGHVVGCRRGGHERNVVVAPGEPNGGVGIGALAPAPLGHSGTLEAVDELLASVPHTLSATKWSARTSSPMIRLEASSCVGAQTQITGSAGSATKRNPRAGVAGSTKPTSVTPSSSIATISSECASRNFNALGRSGERVEHKRDRAVRERRVHRDAQLRRLIF